MAGSSVYPGGLDDFAEASPAQLGDDDTSGRTHSERHDDVEAAVENIQAELGVDPAGAYATVGARLDAAEAAVGTVTAGQVFTVASQVAMLALSAGVGDLAIRTDTNSTYILTATPASTLGNWSLLVTSSTANPTFTGQASFPDGSAGAPSITNTGDTDTGVFFPAADTVAIATGTTERLRVDSSGNVGIGGTANSTCRLDVRGTNTRLRVDTGTTTTKLINTNAAANAYQTLRIEALEASIYCNGNERFLIDSAGLITGSGTSLGAWTAYTPTVTADGGTITSYTLNSAHYVQIGKTVHVSFDVTITDKGTATGGLKLTTPVAAKASGAPGSGVSREVAVTSVAGVVEVAADNAIRTWKYDGTTFLINTYRVRGVATYEAA